MHCILVHLFRGKAVPQVSILNSEVWNRKFRNLGFEIPKLWIPKTAQDCCEKVNGTLDWGIPKILIASWIPKIEQFQKPLLPNKCLLIGSHSHLCCVICMLNAPVSVKACACNLKAQLFNAQQNTASTTDRRKPRADCSPLSAKISSQRYCLLVRNSKLVSFFYSFYFLEQKCAMNNFKTKHSGGLSG